jgi:hypothetical protein
MTRVEILKAIHGDFKAVTRLVFVSEGFHTSMHTDSIAAKNDDLAAAMEGVKDLFVETNTDLMATKNDALAPVVEGVKESFVETNNQLEVEGAEALGCSLLKLCGYGPMQLIYLS